LDKHFIFVNGRNLESRVGQKLKAPIEHIVFSVPPKNDIASSVPARSLHADSEAVLFVAIVAIMVALAVTAG